MSLPSNYLQNIFPFNNEPEAIWLGSCLILRRNLSQYNFPSKLSTPEKEQVLHYLENSFKEINHPHFFHQKDLSMQEREFIHEHFLLLRGLSEPPDGSGIALEEKGDFLALFNTDDHLQMHMLSPKSNWEDAWNRLITLSEKMEKNFAFSPKFGYLTSDLTQCGTGLSTHVYLHLPALIHCKQLQNALGQNEEILSMGFSEGLAEDASEFIGDIVIIQNNFSIGMSEDAILHSVQTCATKLIGAEKTIRSHLKENPSTEIKDLISKAFGVLVHSYQLETKEALNLLSLMRLGLALGEIQNVEDQKLSELFFHCRRGRLLQHFPQLKESEEIAKKRAAYLQEQLRGISLASESPY